MMISKVFDYIEKFYMIEDNDVIIVGVSGGADSVCLLLVLNEYRKKKRFNLRAVHINHMIRGDEADADENYVKQLCEKINVPLVSKHIDVNLLAKEKGLTVEEAGRIARYEAFDKECENVRNYRDDRTMCKIAVAHHMDDQAETILHNIVRGTSIKGLRGMQPVRDNIIRPLLCVSRKEIEKYLSEEKIEFCIDKTNNDNGYTRNKLRNVVIPYLKENINEKTTENINALAYDMSQYYNYIDSEAMKVFEKCVSVKGADCVCKNICIDTIAIKEYPEIIRRHVIMKAIDMILGSLKDITRKHIEAVDELIDMEVSKKMIIANEIEAVKNYNEVEIGFISNDLCECYDENVGIFYSIEEKFEIKKEDIVLLKENFDGDWKKLSNDYTKVFDYDTIKCTPIIRKRESGDYILLKDGRKKSLNRYFIDEKVPGKIRDSIWVLADGNQIMWVLGMRTDEGHLTSSNTRYILKVRLQRR